MNHEGVQLAQQLRASAKGTATTEAAVELLIRGFASRFAGPHNPWIATDDDGGHRVDFTSIPSSVQALSPEERAYLLIAASVGAGGPDGPPVDLHDTIPCLDYDHLVLVLAGLARASGAQEPSGIEIDPVDGTPSFTPHASVYPWPQ